MREFKCVRACVCVCWPMYVTGRVYSLQLAQTWQVCPSPGRRRATTKHLDLMSLANFAQSHYRPKNQSRRPGVNRAARTLVFLPKNFNARFFVRWNVLFSAKATFAPVKNVPARLNYCPDHISKSLKSEKKNSITYGNLSHNPGHELVL